MMNYARYGMLARCSYHAYCTFVILATAAREDGVFRVDGPTLDRMARRRSQDTTTTQDDAIRELMGLLSCVFIGDTLFGEIYGLDKYVDYPHEVI